MLWLQLQRYLMLAPSRMKSVHYTIRCSLGYGTRLNVNARMGVGGGAGTDQAVAEVPLHQTHRLRHVLARFDPGGTRTSIALTSPRRYTYVHGSLGSLMGHACHVQRLHP